MAKILPTFILADATLSMNEPFMRSKKIDELNKQLKVFVQTLRNAPVSKRNTYISVYNFTENLEPVIGDFTQLKELKDIPDIKCRHGVTYLAKSIDSAIDKILDYTEGMEIENVTTPILVVFTDGKSRQFEDEATMERVINRVNTLAVSKESTQRIVLVMVAISAEILGQNPDDRESVAIKNMMLRYAKKGIEGFYNIFVPEDYDENTPSPFADVVKLLSTSVISSNTSRSKVNVILTRESRRQIENDHPHYLFISGPVAGDYQEEKL